MEMKQLAKQEALRFMGGPLPVRTVCPVCLGGSSHEESFVVWESDGNTFATCHRARCEVNTVLVKGTVDVLRNYERHEDQPSQHAYAEGQPLSEPDYEYLEQKCGPDAAISRYASSFPKYMLGYPMWAREGRTSGGMLMPMYDSDGRRRGSIVKPYDKNLPKSLTYKEPDYDGMSWYLTRHHALEGSVVVVEDGLSALAVRGACRRSAVSLNGTLVNKERIDALFKCNKLIYLCLDADATSKALKYAIQYGSRYSIKVIRLDKDFKNMSLAELESFFEENQL